MPYFQRVQIMGVTGDKPTFQIVKTGPNVRFSVCVDEWYRDQQGDSKRISTWFRCSAFGKMAEHIVKQIGKGTWIFAEGRMRVKKVEDREFFSITIDSFRKLEPGNAGTDDAQMPAYEDIPQ